MTAPTRSYWQLVVVRFSVRHLKEETDVRRVFGHADTEDSGVFKKYDHM